MAGETSQFITVGKIVNTQGHRGEVKVIPLTDFLDRFDTMKKIFIGKNGRLESRAIEKTYFHKQFVIVKFVGVDDMNTAELLKNATLMITREELRPLPEDTFYIFDIVGMDVFTSGGRFLGRVKEVLQTGANDVYEVERAAKRPLLIPALKNVVRRVDKAGNKMIVDLPAGLED